jgi:hypothetical protein
VQKVYQRLSHIMTILVPARCINIVRELDQSLMRIIHSVDNLWKVHRGGNKVVDHDIASHVVGLLL